MCPSARDRLAADGGSGAHARCADFRNAQTRPRRVVGRGVHVVPGRAAAAPRGQPDPRRRLRHRQRRAPPGAAARAADHAASASTGWSSARSSPSAPPTGTTCARRSAPPTPATCRSPTATFDSTFCVAVLQHIADVGRSAARIRPRHAARRPHPRRRTGQRRPLLVQLVARRHGRVRRSAQRSSTRWRESRGDVVEPRVGPRLTTLFAESGIEPLEVQPFPVSISRLGPPDRADVAGAPHRQSDADGCRQPTSGRARGRRRYLAGARATTRQAVDPPAPASSSCRARCSSPSSVNGHRVRLARRSPAEVGHQVNG